MRRWPVIAVGALLLALAAWVLAHDISRLGFARFVASLRSIEPAQLAAAVALTLASHIVLTRLDFLGLATAGVRLPARQIALASFVSRTVANNFGVALASGTSARYRFYSRWGVDAADVSRIKLFYRTTFWLGLCLLGGVGLIVAPPPGLTRIAPPPMAVAAGVLALATPAAYIFMCARGRRSLAVGGVTRPLPPPRLALAQLAVSTADWSLAAAVLFVLIPSPRPPFLSVAAAFFVAQVIARVSHVPGGLGVFEAAIVLLLSPAVHGSQILPAVVFYRIVYYLVPLAAALAVLLADEAGQQRQALSEWSRAGRMVAIWAAPRALAFFAFVSGVVLLVSGATPADPGRVAWLARVMPLALVEVSHFAASLAGLFLLLLAQAIARRVDAAFYVAAAALVVGCLGSLLKGGDYEEAIVLALVLAALVAGRHHFTRRARIFEYPLSPGWLAAVAVVVAASTWLGFFAYRHVAYSIDLWWEFAFKADAPRFLRASVGVTILALAIGVRQLLRPVHPVPETPDVGSMADVERVISLQPHTTPYLALLGDKSFLWNESRSAFVMYSVQGNSCVALGDPVGPWSASRDLVKRFVAHAAAMDLLPVFYQVSPTRLTDYAESGLSLVKIGEEARVPLNQFTISGGRHKALRASVNHIQHLGVTFRVAEPIELPALLPELQEVSDEWLALKGSSEKGFSLGFFDPRYIRRFPVALLEYQGRIEAFANLWRGPGGIELSSDLMRHRLTAPKGVMDALFVHLMDWGREQGYEWFNLGMAPLSGMDESSVGQGWPRFARFIYGHGGPFYNFQGLRAYKEKFDPVWESRYLVYPGGLALPRVLADVTALVAGGYRHIFLRAG